jgi:membrane protein DedA with SNARE-associated domain
VGGWLDALLQLVLGLPAGLVYPVLGGLAALENLVPPVPADTIVLLGGFLAGRGAVDPWAVFLVVWICNILGALAVYALGYHYGPAFFHGRVGRRLLQPRQLASLDAFYRRYGFNVIFVSRFLPMFRALVPVFAGVSRLGVVRTAIPMAIASGLWYGLLVWLGATTGRNWEQIRDVIDRSGRWLWIPALLALAGVVVWWWRTRGPHSPE